MRKGLKKQKMKIEKGQPGYLNHKKKVEIIKVIISFGVVAGLILLGYIQTKTKLNWLTFIAVLGCLPAAKLLVGVITRLPHESIAQERAQDIKANTKQLITVYDLIITSYEKVMPIDCLVISNNTLCGYTRNTKVDVAYAAKHIKQMLNQNHIDKISVKIFTDYATFLSRVEGMINIAAVEKAVNKDRELKIQQIILNISL